MKKNYSTLLLAALFAVVLVMAGCKADDEETYIYQKPNWKTMVSREYNTSMVAVVALSHDLAPHIQAGDELAAFVDGECRSVGVYQDGVFYLLIPGQSTEHGKVVFRYYSTKKNYLFETRFDLNFQPDGVYGTADHPEVLTFHVMGK